MALVDASRLRRWGVSDQLIVEYVEAVEAAWDDVALQLMELGSVFGRRPSVALQLKLPCAEPQTVLGAVGRDGRFGVVEATTPAALRVALAQHLLQQFA